MKKGLWMKHCEALFCFVVNTCTDACTHIYIIHLCVCVHVYNKYNIYYIYIIYSSSMVHFYTEKQIDYNLYIGLSYVLYLIYICIKHLFKV